MGLRWIDPLPVVDPKPIDLEEIIESTPAGYVELDPELPGHIAKPFCDLVHSVHQRTNLPEEDIEYCTEKLRAQSYFKACRQLYSAMSDSQKSKLQPLKSVFYDSTYIPTHMGAALAMIGNFDSKLGTVEVKHGNVLFKRWMTKGLIIDPDSSINDTTVVDPNALIWKDAASKDLVDEAIDKKLEEYHNSDTFTVSVAGANVTAGVPRIRIHQTSFNQISPVYPHADEMRALLALRLQSTRAYIAGLPLTGGYQMQDALDALGLEMAPAALSDVNIREEFEDCCATYAVKAKSHIDAVLYVGESPAGNRGFAAQIIGSEGNQARYTMPVSDADRHIGFMFSPATSFELNPRFVAYARRRRDVMAASFAKKDGKAIAM